MPDGMATSEDCNEAAQPITHPHLHTCKVLTHSLGVFPGAAAELGRASRTRCSCPMPRMLRGARRFVQAPSVNSGFRAGVWLLLRGGLRRDFPDFRPLHN